MENKKEKDIRTVDVIVPCFNEEENIMPLYRKVADVAESIERDAGSYEYRYSFSYIFVDDGSSDGTLDEIRKAAAEGVESVTTVKYLSFSRNFGKEAAMYAGLRESAGSGSDFAVIMDADLQHPPELLRSMIGKLEETGCDCVAARRVSRRNEPLIRSAAARMFYRIMNRFSDVEIADGIVDFRIMSGRMVRAAASMPEHCRFSKGIFSWIGFDTELVEFRSAERSAGESKWSLWSLIRYGLDGIVDFTAFPLRAAGVFGSLTALSAAVYIIAEIVKVAVWGKDLPGYSSTICLILFFGGMMMLMLSTIGEYVGRMYMETKRRPVYIVKESSTGERKEKG